MSNPETITTDEIHFIYAPPPNREKKVILLNTGGVAFMGRWGNGEGVIGWHPLPKRNKQLEEELGL
mgnify:CR=1 FL=1